MGFSRFFSPTTREECWPWLGTVDRHGYGKTKFGSPRKTRYAHRVSYELFVGRIPDGREIDHLCKNRLCVNPAHLEAVTRAENFARSSLPARTRERFEAMTECRHHHQRSEFLRIKFYGGKIRRRC